METNKEVVKAPEVLTPQQALNILIQAVQLAQNKGGVYTLSDAALLDRAVKVFTEQNQPQAAQPVATEQPQTEREPEAVEASADESEK